MTHCVETAMNRRSLDFCVQLIGAVFFVAQRPNLFDNRSLMSKIWCAPKLLCQVWMGPYTEILHDPLTNHDIFVQWLHWLQINLFNMISQQIIISMHISESHACIGCGEKVNFEGFFLFQLFSNKFYFSTRSRVLRVLDWGPCSGYYILVHSDIPSTRYSRCRPYSNLSPSIFVSVWKKCNV